MNSRVTHLLKTACAALLIALAAWLLVTHARALGHSGQDTARQWFYNLSKRQLYAAAADIIPPDENNGGGVRAIVVAFQNGAKDPKSLKIAYLKTCSPELKDLLEQIKAARAAHRVFAGTIPPRGSGYFETKTLVRRLDESDWHAVNTPEGRKIMAEWRSWRGPLGERPQASVP